MYIEYVTARYNILLYGDRVLQRRTLQQWTLQRSKIWQRTLQQSSSKRSGHCSGATRSSQSYITMNAMAVLCPETQLLAL